MEIRRSIIACIAFLMLTVPTTIAEDRIVHLMENRLSWMSAYEICRYHDWQLLTLRSNQEHEETVELMKNTT